MSADPGSYDPDDATWPGPRCPQCGSPCHVWFGPVPGRFCPVCHGNHEGEYRVYCTVIVTAGNAELAQQKVADTLTGIGRMVTAEPGKQGEFR